MKLILKKHFQPFPGKQDFILLLKADFQTQPHLVGQLWSARQLVKLVSEEYGT